MVLIKNPTNITYKGLSKSTTFPDGDGKGEIVILGTDSSITIIVTDNIVDEAQTQLTALDPIEDQILDPLEDLGPLTVKDPGERFSASYIAFDNNNDGWNTTMVVKKGLNDFLIVNMKSKIREDLSNALAGLETYMTP